MQAQRRTNGSGAAARARPFFSHLAHTMLTRDADDDGARAAAAAVCVVPLRVRS
jgi:hypothetical protein